MSSTELHTLAKQHAVDLQPDWLAFAKRAPKGARVADDSALSEWPGVTTPGKPSAAKWVDDIAEIFGADSLASQFSKKRPQLHFWDQRLLRHAYPVASTFGGDPIVQVTSGRRAGQILLTNHESWFGFFEELAKLGGKGRLDEEFDDEAMPLLRRLGYKGGAPTTDQVIGVLLHRDFDGATSIAKSFSDFYCAVWRAKRPAAEAGARGAKGAARVVEIPTSARVIGANRERAYMGGPYGDALVAMAVDGTIEQLVRCPGITGIVAHAGGTYVSGKDGIHAWKDGDKSFKLVLRGRFDSMSRDERNHLWLAARRGEKNALWYSTDWRKFKSVPAPENGLVRLHREGAGGVLISSFDELFVAADGKPPTSLATPAQYERIEAAIATSHGTLLVGMDGDTDLLRSVDRGKTWKKAKIGARGVSCLFETSDGAIVAATGRRLWISKDDGRRFEAITARIADTVHAGAELGGEILLVAGTELVRVTRAMRR